MCCAGDGTHVLRTLKDVLPGDALTHSYLTTMEARGTRQEVLNAHYGSR
jgi:hypothetical protein